MPARRFLAGSIGRSKLRARVRERRTWSCWFFANTRSSVRTAQIGLDKRARGAMDRGVSAYFTMNLPTRLRHSVVTCLGLLAPLSAASAQDLGAPPCVHDDAESVPCCLQVQAAPAAAAPSLPKVTVERAPQAAAPAADSGESLDYTTARTEFAGAPLIGGNSDIGFEFGLVLTATHFGDDTRPYRWNSDLVLAASLKGGPDGAEIAQQSYLMQVDVPDVVPGRGGVTITRSFKRTQHKSELCVVSRSLI
jgi:hypothetical protein